ncbi:hypothetical protein GPECTOR_6g516 [Gonium pectorale]|uniref:Uncharacterized protein n=1 Tax=Gonium pectorale TaxID=33097 RepID=A0A150GUS9_GONPE|nr:hypothetical protein GPECTOR_6g516 [Gonium pectorale]|eukprot:KXZ53599.1 hypothetical protein GPECTOR_6g516 [Gonium pectorale]
MPRGPRARAAALQVVLDMAERLPGVEADDLPALVRFIVQYSTGGAASGAASAAGGGTAASVVAALRRELRMVEPSDPRVGVRDTKGKRGGGRGGREPVEVRLLRELAVALAANDAAAGAAIKAITAAGRVRVGPGGSSVGDPGGPDPDDPDGGSQAAEDRNPGGRGGGGGAAALAGGPPKLVSLDLWLLLLLLGGRRGKEADKVLRAKILDGTASPAWLADALLGHPAALREAWGPLAALAAGLAGSRPAGGPLAAAAARLYAVMFAAMGAAEDSLQRIEVLHCLHTHLGSGVAEEVDTALAALAQLAEGPLSRPAATARAPGGPGAPPPAPSLSSHGSALGSCLDHLEAFSDGQLAALFDMLAAVTGGAEGVAWKAAQEEAAAGPAAADPSAVVRVPGGAGDRLESEVAIVVDKALKGGGPYKRMGVAGALAFLRRVGCALSLLVGGGPGPSPPQGPAEEDEEGGGGVAGGGAAAGQPPSPPGFGLLIREWRGRLQDLVAATEGHAAARALALTRLRELLERPCGGGGGGGGGGPAAAVFGQEAAAGGGGGAVPWGASLPRWAQTVLLAEVFQPLLENALVRDIEPAPTDLRLPGCDQPLGCSAWFNIDKEDAPVAIGLWPLAVSAAAADRDVLVWMGPCLGLVCTASTGLYGDLADVDALLGGPVFMFPTELLQDAEGVNHLHELPPCVSAAVLTSIQAATSWLRELLNCFGPGRTSRSQGTQSDAKNAKISRRVAQLAALEALGAALLDNLAPPRGGLAAAQALRNHADPAGLRATAPRPALMGPPALQAAAGAARKPRAGGGAAGAAAATGTAASRAAAALALRRVAAAAGGAAAAGCAHEWGAWTVLPNRLAAAAYLVSELAAKTRFVAARSRSSPAFAAVAGGAAAGASAADPSLEGVGPGELACCLAGLMPAVRQHLDTATAALAGLNRSTGRGAAAGSEPVAGYAALTDATLVAWYRGAWEVFADAWAANCAALRAAERHVPGQEEEDDLVACTLTSAGVFAKLLELVKRHPAKTPLLATAVKGAGKFVEVRSLTSAQVRRAAWRRAE